MSAGNGGGASGSGGWQWGDSFPKDIRMEVDAMNGTIPVQTSNNSGSNSGSGNEQGSGAGAGTSGSGQQQPNGDIAGVLKRNQACLQCRRRKLKCDAVRPHCATCIRSHNHTLRTAPNSGAVLTCDYDDGPTDKPAGGPAGAAAVPGNGLGKDHLHSPASNEEQEANGQARKKRKPTQQSGNGSNGSGPSGQGKKKDDEADKLRRKIEELEAQLANQQQNVASASQAPAAHASRNVSVDTSGQAWAIPGGMHLPFSASAGTMSSAASSSGNYGRGGDAQVHGLDPSMPMSISAQSPTAFLEMLSSAATAHHPSRTGSGSTGAGISALKEGVNGAAMVTGGIYSAPTPLGMGMGDIGGEQGGSTGMTPFLNSSYGDPSDPNNERDQDQTGRPQIAHINSVSDQSDASRRPSDSVGAGGSSSRQSSGIYANSAIPPLTPSAIFNFPPTPAASGDDTNAQGGSSGQAYMPQFDDQGNLKPSTKLDGPWRAVETVDTYLASAGIPNNNAQLGHGHGHFSMEAAAEGILPDLPPLDEALQQQLLMDLFWPGWPMHLPEPNIVNDLIEAFFELVPGLPRLLHKGRFLARMALPPTHSNFPHPSLIHSICSIASNWCAPALYERSNFARAFDPKTGKEWSFALRQASLAKEQVHEGLNTGNRMFDVVRAMMILSRIFIDDTRMLECWAYNGLVARMILPLGLNVRSAGLSLKSVMLPPPADAIEREERRASMWFAVYHDTIASAASGWGTSIALDELSIPLPVSAKDFDSGNETIESNPQDLDSADLYTRHPIVDPFVMTLKASVLLNRVNKFARKWKNRHVRDHDDYEGMARGEFRELANSIACFQMSFPPELRNPCKVGPKRKLDVDLIAAHLMPHAAIICLYEPFANLDDPTDQAAQRILNAAQAIVGTVQQMAALVLEGVQNFTTVMHSSTSISLVTSARTCLLFYRHALNNGDLAAAESLRADVEMIRMALAQLGLKFKIGHHHAQLVEYFMDRATNPTYDKMSAHYPEHPRPGAPVLHPDADLGVCVMNALNVKRGYWRIANAKLNTTGVRGQPYGQAFAQNQNQGSNQDGISPFGTSSTPGSSGAPASTTGSFNTRGSSEKNPNGRWSDQMPSKGPYPNLPDTGDVYGDGKGGAANDEARIHSISQSASNSASHSPNNPFGISNIGLDAQGMPNIALTDYMTGVAAQTGRTSAGDDGTANIGFMLPNVGFNGPNSIAADGQIPNGAPDKWRIMENLFTTLRSDGTRDSFNLTTQETGTAGMASLGSRTGVVEERHQYGAIRVNSGGAKVAGGVPAGLPNSASWFIQTGTERVFDRMPR